MTNHKMWIRARSAFHAFGVDLIIMGESQSGRKTIVKEIVYEDVEDFICTPPKAITLDETSAKRLMDDLWLAGVRPSKELYGSTDKEDIKNHLEDMRKIVFNGITISLSNQKVDTPPKE